MSVLYSIKKVAPLAGAWIEMPRRRRDGKSDDVAPLAGAWIEIDWTTLTLNFDLVAPLAGAWIEMIFSIVPACAVAGRTPRGCVD